MLNPGVLFDLDGTLTDPKPGITRCCAHALERLGRGTVDPETLAWCIGPPLRDSFAKILESDDADLVEQAVALYRERFSTVGLFENEVYEGIPELLDSLRANGLRLFVATSKPQVFAERILEHFQLTPYFEGIVGSELDGRREAKREVIEHVLVSHGVRAESALMVGDRRHDVEGARAHGIPCVGVSYGYGLEGELHAAGAWKVCAHPHEIYASVEAFLQSSGVSPNTSESNRSPSALTPSLANVPS